MFKLFSGLFLALMLAACSQEQEQVVTTPLIVYTSNGEIRFNVEVAQTPEQLKKGLMHRTQMPLNNGMIFSIYPVRPTAMWMKNTKISLDMLFIAPDTSISQIVESATPLSEELIVSKEPVRAVIELNAGQAKRYGIKVGDKINHQLFANLTTLSDEPVAPQPVVAKGPVPVVPDSPNIAVDGAVMPKGPNANPDGQVFPKGPNANPDGQVFPKGPNANPDGQVLPKGPNANPDGQVFPKGPNANPDGQVLPKGPNANPDGQVFPKGPNANPDAIPVPSPM
jgi:hypothetical protein